MTSLLEATRLTIEFDSVPAVDDVDLAVPRGPWGVGLIGESGSGKTTIARALVRLVPPTSGRVSFDGRDVSELRGKEARAYRRAVQIVFQEDEAALDPRMRVSGAVREGLRAHRLAHSEARIAELLADVDLEPELARRYPHELSGGQRQRVGIARALAVEPQVIVLYEPTSAVDVTVQARILDLIGRLRDQRDLAYLLISHNLAVVDRLCEESIVLYRGVIVERGRTRLLLSRPAHPYTQELRASVPELGRPAATVRARRSGHAAGDIGCRFAHRCDLATDLCRRERPPLRMLPDGREVACHRVEDALARRAERGD